MEEKAAFCGSLACSSDTSCMIADHAVDQRTIRSFTLESRMTLMSTYRDCWNCRVHHSTLHTTCSRDSKEGDPELIVAPPIHRKEVFKVQLVNGHFRQKSGRKDVWFKPVLKLVPVSTRTKRNLFLDTPEVVRTSPGKNKSPARGLPQYIFSFVHVFIVEVEKISPPT